jgi:hypothetical protein
VRDVAVILAFFQPVAYKLPQMHFHAIVQTLHAQGVPLAVAQAVYPGQKPQPLPEVIPQVALPTKSLLFHKERLWNIAARTLTDATRLIFLDADLVFAESDWLDRCLDALDRHDVIQPYSTARWLDERGLVDMERPPSTDAIRDGLRPALKYYHPGFGFGIRREAFDKLGGFYDRSVSGNGDALFALALRDNILHDVVAAWFCNRQDKTIASDSYKTYKSRAVACNFKVGSPAGVTVTHLWHGSRDNRQYIERGDMFPRRSDGEYAVHESDSGLLEWDDVAAGNRSVSPYFVGKRDDG